jgi:UDP-N-acetylmuramate: L-alanyl-gamma-D-glutamyl-meso-diaminopimelate ligase
LPRNLADVHRVYLLGIGGAAMAPVAGMLKESGYDVTGADAGVYPPASTLLASLNIPWHPEFRAEHLQPQPDLVVIGNVIARGNPELEIVLEQKIPYISMAALLEEFFLPGHRNIVVAGTHGKSTTSAMLAWIFQCAGRQPDFLVGGVLPNFGGCSYALGGGAEFIIEGDEYETAFFDRGSKFFHYHPDELILTSCEFDHGDIYADLAAVELQFQRLVNLVPRNGRVLAWGESESVARCVRKAFCPVETYAVSTPADWNASEVARRTDPFQRRTSRQAGGAIANGAGGKPQCGQCVGCGCACQRIRHRMGCNSARTGDIPRRCPPHGR